MSNKSEVNVQGVGVLGLLGVVFVTLKLLEVIDWSWWWVTLPFWGGLALVLSVILLAATVYAGVCGLEWIYKKWDNRSNTGR